MIFQEKHNPQKARTFSFLICKPKYLVATIILGCLGEPLLATINLFMPEVIAPLQAQTVPTEVRRAYQLLGQGLVNDAIATFKKAVQQYPESLDAKIGLGIAYRRAGNINDAWQIYQQALAQNPTNQLILKTIGLLGTYKKEWQVQGIEALTTLLNLSPQDTQARGNRALLYGYQGRFAEALADYKIVLAINQSPENLVGAAQIYSYTGKFTESIELFNRYQAQGNSITGYPAIAYSRALRETGNPAAAVKILEAQLSQSKQLNDQTIQTRSELSQSYLANQQSAQALAVLDPLRGRIDAILPLARSLNEIGRKANQPSLSQEAASLYKQALNQTLNPDVQLMREVADVLSGIDSEKQISLQLYRQLVTKQPDNKNLLLQKLSLENELGLISVSELKQGLRKALNPVPIDKYEQQLLAQALIKISPPDPEFLPVYETLISANINQPFLHFRLAQIFIQKNDLVAARNSLAIYTATSAGQKDQAPELLLAEIELREGNLNSSAQRYQNIIAGNSTDKNLLNGAWRGLAEVRVTQKRFDEAIAIYDQLSGQNPQDLKIQLRRASLAYQTQKISVSQAEAVLSNWLSTQPASDTPAELFSLVAILPAATQRESLYNSLLEVNPQNIGVQLRLIQVIALRNPAQARARVAKLITQDPNNIGAYFAQGQLAKAIGDLDLASQAYQSILQKQPDNNDAMSALAGIKFEQGEYESAETLYMQVLTVKPDDPVANRSLAGLAALKDRPLEALQQLEKLQLEQISNGNSDQELSRQRQLLQEDFLRRRGFQPPWEKY